MQPECESPAIPASKTQRLSTPSQKVCLVFHCWNAKSDEYKFYIVDCDSSSGDEYPYTKPTMRFKERSTPVAFCALNSTLYMFEGLHPFTNPQVEDKSAWKFHITPEILAGSNCKLHRNKNLVSIKPMHHKKLSPKALPTPDGKRILVFSSDMFWNQDEYSGGRFELYDVDGDSWESLPSIPRFPHKPLHDLEIQSYGFENDSHFMMHTMYGAVALNLKTKEWEIEPIHRVVDVNFLGIGEFHFTPSGAYDIRDLRLFEFPNLTSFPRDVDADKDPEYIVFRHRLPPYITVLGHPKDGLYDMCVVRAQRYPYHRVRTRNLRVVLDIYGTDYEKFKIEVDKFKIEEEENSTPDIRFRMRSGENKGEEEFKVEVEEKPTLNIRCHTSFDDEGEEHEVYTSKPLRNSTTPIKAVKLLIDFDFYTYVSGQVYAFSI